jgi:hypothetical protein
MDRTFPFTVVRAALESISFVLREKVDGYYVFSRPWDDLEPCFAVMENQVSEEAYEIIMQLVRDERGAVSPDAPILHVVKLSDDLPNVRGREKLRPTRHTGHARRASNRHGAPIRK